MNWSLIVLGAVLAFVAYKLVRPSPGVDSGAPDLTAAELAERLRSGDRPVLVDVREPSEYQGGHIPGARLLPLGGLRARAAEVPRDREVVVVCRSGRRSGVARAQLGALGYTNVRNLRGGMLAWRGPVEK